MGVGGRSDYRDDNEGILKVIEGKKGKKRRGN